MDSRECTIRSFLWASTIAFLCVDPKAIMFIPDFEKVRKSEFFYRIMPVIPHSQSYKLSCCEMVDTSSGCDISMTTTL